MLDDGLSVILARYPGLAFRQRVPCVCRDEDGEDCTTMYDYEGLVLSLQAGRTSAQCVDSFKTVDIATMLYGLRQLSQDSARPAEMLFELRRRLDEIIAANAGESELMQHEFMRTQTLIGRWQELRCPSVFTITALQRRRLRSTQEYTLRHRFIANVRHRRLVAHDRRIRPEVTTTAEPHESPAHSRIQLPY